MAEISDEARRLLLARILADPSVQYSPARRAILDYLSKSNAPVGMDDISQDVFKTGKEDFNALRIRGLIRDLRSTLDEYFERSPEGRKSPFRVVIPPGHAGYRLTFVENVTKKSENVIRRPTVFISSSIEGVPIARELAQQLATDADINLWSAALRSGLTASESLTEAADRSDFAIFIILGEDHPGTESKGQPRQNALFEMGFLAGRLGLDRIFIVVAEHKKPVLPGDLAGTMFIALPILAEGDLKLTVTPAADSIRKALRDAEPRRNKTVDYHSCFVSYSWKDREFATVLHADLLRVGVRCWLDEKELRTGDRVKEQIDRALQAHDKVLLVLSDSSIRSTWVRFELRNALRLEAERQKTVLFPIRLDQSALEIIGPEFDQLRDKYITDFSNWKDEGRYRRAFSALVRDLAISASVESGGQP